MTDPAREVVLVHSVTAAPVAADFTVVARHRTAPEGDGWLKVRPLFLSLDPYMGACIRGRHMGEPAPAPGEPLPGFCVAEVEASRDPAFAPGDRVVTEAGWTDLAWVPSERARRVSTDIAASLHLSVLGMPGLTAWAGMTQLAKIGAGDLLTVNAAAGTVGGVAGQIARNLGGRAIGIAGGSQKCDLVVDRYGFDACIDYRTEDWEMQLASAVAPGSTIHFENVGAGQLAVGIRNLKLYGRVVLCGLADHYHADAGPAVTAIGPLVGKRAAVFGLVVYDFYPRWSEWTALAEPWVKAGRLTIAEDIRQGLDSAGAQLERLVRGENVGKTLVQVA
ncbi:NADP-dependent oxidoreductase [Phenylobacterium sp.]|uniref:MDR family NADP-dependent oxidoreductase n=1 Tax=Phenylobacterium sp. TaxID=1871053 RepID=UPI0025DA7F08|nr:NADP-dependent oxidoreductase [Phenylobacterium sp.]MCA3585767.1 NADP-dependent oxidoreductase [Methylocystis sp.]MCA6286855.1 NADP-dependent oxidoreductase [Phenylobacterium sp.]MCA6346211.1 NADP-dependent oxidoreductase [Phenylobacterium sp.]MCA6349524.1 NADP-dependent oxidoreductase [Phenylobacterium sp.]MCA6351224.1 NADP-dependent oxidoreductase [Phenylobacterium sp.]